MAGLRKEKSVAVLQIRPCGFVQFSRFFLCLCTSAGKPLWLLDSLRSNPTEPFCRSNPRIRSIREHCLMCLGNLPC
jgi:hypothetical protein